MITFEIPEISNEQKLALYKAMLQQIGGQFIFENAKNSLTIKKETFIRHSPVGYTEAVVRLCNELKIADLTFCVDAAYFDNEKQNYVEFGIRRVKTTSTLSVAVFVYDCGKWKLQPMEQKEFPIRTVHPFRNRKDYMGATNIGWRDKR